jgi:hypothetical protein
MPISHLQLPEFQSGISNPDTWINAVLSTIVSVQFDAVPEIITNHPTTVVPNKIYLVDAGSTFASPGSIAIYKDVSTTSLFGFVPPIGTVIGGWTKYLGGWTRDSNTMVTGITKAVVNGSLVIDSTGSLLVPADFNGYAVVSSTDVNFTIFAAPGITAAVGSRVGTVVGVGVYLISQDQNILNMS